MHGLGHARRLQRIMVDNAAAHSLCPALRTGGAGFLPALSSFVITRRYPLTLTPLDSGSVLTNMLPLCLEERARVGHALKSIDVAECHF